MKRALLPFAVLVASLAVAQQAPRTPQGGPGGAARGGFGSVFMLFMPEVQKEIGLTAGQKSELEKLLQGSMGGPRPQGGPGGPGGQGGQRPGGGDIQQRFQETEKKLNALLKPAQKTRLEQLALQAQGPMALQRDDVAAKLGLSGKQKTAIRTIAEKSRPQFGRQGQGGQPQPQDWEKLRKEMEAKREAANKQILATLDTKQKAAWTKMLGKPFKFPQRQMRGGAGGPGPRPGGGGRGGE